MPNWGEVLKEIQGTVIENPLDINRKKYMSTLHEYTNRNVISYYSAFLQKGGISSASIDDNDKNAFMQAVHGLDKSKGLDLILHTPGGDVAATESIVGYLKKIFNKDIRAIIPQIAMSAGTMIALACKEIIMGKQSNIGPIDPQFGGMSCAGIIEEFDKAVEQCERRPAATPLWQTIISKYHPSFLGDCERAIDWSKSIVTNWLMSNMFSQEVNAEHTVHQIVEKLSDYEATKNHARHIDAEEAKELGLKILDLENLEKKEIGDCKDLQDCVLTLHHSYMLTFSQSNALKIVENHKGNAMILQANPK